MNVPRCLTVGATAAGLVVMLASGLGRAAEATSSPDSLAATVTGSLSLPEQEYFWLGADQRPLALARGGIESGSVRLLVGGKTWQPGVDFRLRARSGLIVPLRAWTEAGHVAATITYRFTPGPAQPRIGWRAMAPPPVVNQSGAQPIEAPLTSWDLDRTGDLEVRGSKSVQVSSGTNRELTVDQNLRLDVSGQLTPDIFVRAALTDDNLPVVPEGNTEELQDIDKVLVELEARRWRATLGDFVARREGTYFGSYRRKLQGFSVTATPGDAIGELLFGSPRGRYRTVEIRGEESNQGPYNLGSGDTGRNLFVVAGSERVTVDGALMTRGEDRDYVIDYVRGTVTFTYRRLITAESLVIVEFEEGEGPYARSVVGGGGGARFTLKNRPATVRARIIREADDPKRLRSGELSEADEAVLVAAGDDPLFAVASGVTQVEPGAGDYVLVGSGDDAHYEFDEENGDWDVAFFHAGAGNGDYQLISLTETGIRIYEWVGAGLGLYRVGRQLPLPGSQDLVSLTADLGDSLGAGLHAEWQLSQSDRNVLSAESDGDNSGQAAQIAVRSGRLDVAGGDLNLTGFWADRDARFVPFTVPKTIHDYEGWGLGERARREGFLADSDREMAAQIDWQRTAPGRDLGFVVRTGRLDHGAGLTADRVQASGRWQYRGGRGRHLWRQASSRDHDDPLDVLRRDQEHDLSWTVGPVVPRAGFVHRSWFDDAVTGTRGRGYRLEEVTGGLASRPGLAWRWEMAFTHGIADSLRETRWRHERDSRTWRGAVTTPRTGGLRLVADGTVREVKRPDGRDETTRLARLELAGNWSGIGSEWSLGYGVDNSRTEVLARQVVFVGIGQGRYDQAGNFVGDQRGDFDLVLAGTDSLVATTAVKANLSWRQDVSVLGKDRLWTAWVSQTRVGLEGRSRTDDIAGLLRLDPAVVFDGETVVLGRLDLNQEITFLRHLRSWDLRWRFDFNQARDRQYAQGREDRLGRKHLVTTAWNPLPTVSLRTRLGHADERRETESQLNPTLQSYDSVTRRVELEGAWRPRAGSRASLAVEVLTRRDGFSGVDQRELALVPSVRWRLRRDWSLQAELRMAEVRSDEPAGVRRPFFFPPPGTNFESSTRLAWEPSRFLGFALAWFGRQPGGQEWQHDLRLESTARF